MKNLSNSKNAAFLFVFLEAVIYFTYIAADLGFFNFDDTALKFLSICLCLLFSAIFSAQGGEKLITAAMALTLAADYLLLVKNSYYEVGVVLFLTVQTVYCYIMTVENGKTLWALRAFLFALAVLVLWEIKMLSLLNALTAFYITGFACNIVQSFTVREKSFRLFSVGLILFFCCDLFVGIFNIPMPHNTELVEIASLGMWALYLPAQIIIVIFGMKRGKK